MTKRNDHLQNRYPHMVQEHMVAQVRDVMERRRQRIAGLKTRADAEAYVRRVRRAVRRSFGPFPKRTPLNARITGRDAYPHYDLEKIVFESRPGLLVTGNLYIPHGMQPGEKRPTVMGLCGHWGGGKACDLYQSFCQGLAVKGFLVFIIDPISQGERRQFFPDDGGKRPNLCHAHNLMGNSMVLLDDFFGSWRVWDAVRGLDYLLSRPEADRTRVGVTGNSGGGTLSAYLTAVDPRLTMAAPSCYICSYLANLENEIPSDAEQNPPDIIKQGLDQVDLLLCYAPRPTLILGQHDDFFDVRWTRRAHEDMARVHRLLGSDESAAFFAGPREHGYHRENREAMYEFFLKHAGMDGDGKERHVKPVPEKRLWAVPYGNTRRAGSRRVFDFLDDEAVRQRKGRGRPSAQRVKRAAAKLLDVSSSKDAPWFRVLAHLSDPAGPVKQHGVFAVETEPGVQAIVTSYAQKGPVMHPPQGKVTLYVGHVSADEDVRREPEVRKLARGHRPFLTVDPRGIGQSFPKISLSREFCAPYGSDYLYATFGEMLGENTLGRRVHDVMRVMDFLLAEGAEEVRLVGRGVGSVTAAFAALLHPSEPAVRLMDYLPSYQSIIDARITIWPLSTMLRGCLRHFDLPDVYRALGKRLTKRRAWDAMMKPDKR